MLAQNFRTPAELELGPEVFECLVAVLGMLERGEIDAANFNMTEWWEPPEGWKPGQDHRDHVCGSVGCIGGWAEHIGLCRGYELGDWLEMETSELLSDLFYPYCHPTAWGATPAQAALALRSYLTTGEDGWEAVFPKRRRRR